MNKRLTDFLDRKIKTKYYVGRVPEHGNERFSNFMREYVSGTTQVMFAIFAITLLMSVLAKY